MKIESLWWGFFVKLNYFLLHDFELQWRMFNRNLKAECDRVFSSMGLVITKYRKSMKSELLDALIKIKMFTKE